MEDKTFELLTQMYSEFKEFRVETKTEFSLVNKRLGKLENSLIKVETIIENEIRPNIKLSLEGYQAVYEKLQEHDDRFTNIEDKLEKQEVEITVIKGGRKNIK